MYFKKKERIKLLILTDFNVSNIHYMIAYHLQKDERFETLFLDFDSKPFFYNDFKWFLERQIDATFNLSNFFPKSIVKRLLNTTRLIKESDIVVTSGMIANLVWLIHKPYIYWSYGSDLDQYAKYGLPIFTLKEQENFPLFRKYRRKIIGFINKQFFRLAIQKADVAIISQYQYSEISRLGYKKLGFFPHLLEENFRNITLEDRKDNKKWIKEHYDCERILFSSSRHVWDKFFEKENDFKGNNIIIESLKLYLEKTKDEGIKLFLIEKGCDVELTKILIKEFELEKYIVWLEHMPRRNLLKFYSGADLFFGDFGIGCFTLCPVEAMSCGTITISFIGERNSNVPFYSETPYLLNTKNPNEISDYMIKIFSNNSFKEEEERNTFEWIRRNNSPHAICNSVFQMADSIIGHK